MPSNQDTQRKDRLRAAMTEAGLDAIITASPSEVLLLTGYWPIFSTSVAVFTKHGKCFAIVPEDEQELASETGNAEWISYKPELKDRITGPVRELNEPLGTLLHKLPLEQATIGFAQTLGEEPAPYLTGLSFRSSLRRLVGKLCPTARLVTCDTLLERQKAVKTTRELDLMHKAVRVARDGFAAAADAIRPGLREAEVASLIQAAFDSSPAAEAVERSEGKFFCMSGPNSALAAAAFARTRQRRLQEGDLVMIHANTCADGLWTDITRTFTVGTPPARHQEMRSAIQAATQAALAAIRPGIPAREVDAAARAVMTQRGFGEAFKHATGHGVGYAAAYANALPRIHPHSRDWLEAGMTFNVEPAAYFKDYGGMRHCNVVAVTDSGVDLLTDF